MSLMHAAAPIPPSHLLDVPHLAPRGLGPGIGPRCRWRTPEQTLLPGGHHHRRFGVLLLALAAEGSRRGRAEACDAGVFEPNEARAIAEGAPREG